MSETDYGRPSTARDAGDFREKDHRELKREEAHIEIGRLVGYNNGGTTSLTKHCLWSIYWALTGDVICSRRKINTQDGPSAAKLRHNVAQAAGFHYHTENLRRAETSDLISPAPKRFRRNQLQAVVYALRNTPDHRPHGLTSGE